MRNDDRLLRITKAQFYNPEHAVDEEQTLENCRIMNSLDKSGISVRCQHIAGGACLVEDAGNSVQRNLVGQKKIIEEAFRKLEKWSLDTGVVILDYNEGNWCIKAGVLRLIDIDMRYTCRLSEICHNPIVLKHIDCGVNSIEKTLTAFLEKEAQLLCDHLGLEPDQADSLKEKS
jgi:hypothetical protein